MKKIIIALVLIMTVGILAGCGSSNSGSASTTSDNNSQESTTVAKPDGKTLIVYFSWSGNTKEVAEALQEKTGADIFEIQPETPYSDDYDAVVDLAKEEQSEGARPTIANIVENIDEYDTILFGYPNWWGDMPMIMYTFLDDYDLSRKTIAPFVTSSSSGLSNTVEQIKAEESKATVTEGLSITEDDLDDADSYIDAWLKTIGLAE